MSPYRQKEINLLKSWFLISVFVGFVSLLGYLLSYLTGSREIFWVAAFLAIFLSLLSWFNGDKIVLKLAGARKINKDEAPEIFRIVENVSLSAGLVKPPELYIIPSNALNAFATGKNPKKSYVAVTSGLINSLTKRELEGVIAHEISHIKNRDILVMLFAAILSGCVAILADFFLRAGLFSYEDRERRSINFVFIIVGAILAFLAPIFAQLIQLAISRQREFLADASGALLTRDPEGLASALEKIAQLEKQELDVSPAISPLFFVTPKTKHGLRKWFTNLFSTHPPIEERIKALRRML